MDVCILSMIATLNAVACLPQQVCYERNNVKYCKPDYSIQTTCNQIPKQHWDCKRPDGSMYVKEFKAE